MLIVICIGSDVYTMYQSPYSDMLPPFWDSANNFSMPVCVDAVEVHCFSSESAGPVSILHRKLLKYGLRQKWTERFQIDLNEGRDSVMAISCGSKSRCLQV